MCLMQSDKNKKYFFKFESDWKIRRFFFMEGINATMKNFRNRRWLYSTQRTSMR